MKPFLTEISSTSTADLIKDRNNLSILYVGNSFIYTGDIPKQVSILSKMYGLNIVYDTICFAGAKLRYTMNEAIEKMKTNQFDFAIFQDYGSRPVLRRIDFLHDLKLLCEEARKSNAIPALYNPAWVNIDGKPNRKYQALLTSSYEKAAQINDAILINAAEAWIYSYEKYPDIFLYEKDDFHANDVGAYLTACVFSSTLFDLHIKNINKDNLYHGEYAITLGQVAWEYVSRYNKKNKIKKNLVEFIG